MNEGANLDHHLQQFKLKDTPCNDIFSRHFMLGFSNYSVV